MIEGLMHICRMWGEPGWNPDVNKEFGIFKTEPGQPLHIWPCGDEQRRLDKICASCTDRLFEVESLECPICEKETLKPCLPFEALSAGSLKRSLTEFFFTCSACGTRCVSYKDLVRAR